MATEVDLVLKNARVLDVFSGEIMEPISLAIKGDKIAGWGNYKGRNEVDLAGKVVIPGLIDGHLHLESAMVTPSQFARAVVPRGTTAVVADPHEIANVCGSEGIDYILKASANLPLQVFITVPSCVPATSMEDGGACLDSKEVSSWMRHPRVVGLAEVMDVPAVLRKDQEMMSKLKAARTTGKVIDGHAPGLSGEALMQYRAEGISSDHECTHPSEALEKLSLGFRLMLRQGTAAKNLLDLLPVVSADNLRFCMLVTDDRHPEDLLREGHMDHLIRLAINGGLNPVNAIRMATINTAEYFHLGGIGAIAPGYRADLAVLADLEDFKVEKVYSGGRLVADQGLPLFREDALSPAGVENTCSVHPLSCDDFKIPASSDLARVMELIPNQIITKKTVIRVKRRGNEFLASAAEDIAKLAVIERHHATGRIGKALVKGFGLKKGALASTVSHDAHNMVVLGMSSEEMLLAASTVAKIGGGLALVQGNQVKGTLPLEIAGLMSTASLEEVAGTLAELQQQARGLGIREGFDPFLTMAFMSLAVIPELKVTNRGLVDVVSQTIVSLSESVEVN